MSFTLINASAGTGKTHTLTQEIAQRIRAGLRPSQLIATTFTKKAAAELTDRVHRTLLQDGQLDAAGGIDSALIGTVNAVSGQLLQEFALDAGISPDVQILDEDTQRAAFSAAIDEAAAHAGSRASDLLARTEHDGPEQSDLPYGSSPSWRAQVRILASRARTNRLDAARLRESAELSWEEYRLALGAPGEDHRAAWRSGLAAAIEGLRADLAATDGDTGGGSGTPLPARSAGAVRKHLPSLEQLQRQLQDPRHAP